MLPVGAWIFEPKWDGFRCLAFKAGTAVDIRAKSGKPLGRYFPELIELLRSLPARWQLPAVLLAAAAAFSIGCSRVFLRVHHASDVVAGFASGGAWLTVCIASVEATRWYRRTRREKE